MRRTGTSSHLRADEAENAAVALEADLAARAQAIEEGANPDLVRARGDVRKSARSTYTARPDAKVYSLLLPTGYGKTLTGCAWHLRDARTGHRRCIIYVAPYLSILSQAAAEIRNSSGLEVFVHHHMTTAELDDSDPYDALDTWQTPVLATTFNQLFRPCSLAGAEQCLRIPALDGAFLFIDEPQIVDVTVWNLFLRTLAVVLEQLGGQALQPPHRLRRDRVGLSQSLWLPATTPASTPSSISGIVARSGPLGHRGDRKAEQARQEVRFPRQRRRNLKTVQMPRRSTKGS